MGILLFVDDIRPAPEGWQLARTVTEAIRILDTQDVEEVSLDHDISHDVKVGDIHRPYPCGETFEPVARFMAALATIEQLDGDNDIGLMQKDGPIPKMFIHTANPAGAQKMADILKAAGLSVDIMIGDKCIRQERP